MNLDGSGVEIGRHGRAQHRRLRLRPEDRRPLVHQQRPRLALGGPAQRHAEPRRQDRQEHFGYPYCHQGNIADPEFGWGKTCADFAQPALFTGPHAGTLGMRFYTGKMFPAKYQGAIFIARHGSWNRTKIFGGDIVVAWPDGKGGIAKMEPFLTGFVENNQYLGRPVDVLVMKDGSLLVSDDHAGAIYRISYRANDGAFLSPAAMLTLASPLPRSRRSWPASGQPRRPRCGPGGPHRAAAPRRRAADCLGARGDVRRPLGDAAATDRRPRSGAALPPALRVGALRRLSRRQRAWRRRARRARRPARLLCDHAALPLSRGTAQQRSDDRSRQDAERRRPARLSAVIDTAPAGAATARRQRRPICADGQGAATGAPAQVRVLPR